MNSAPSARAAHHLSSGEQHAAQSMWLRHEAVIAGRLLVIGATVFGAVWLAMEIKVVVVAAFLGFAQSALLWPVVKRLREHLPNGLAALLVMTLYVAAIGWLIWFIVTELANAWPDLVTAAIDSADAANNWFLDRGWAVPPSMIDDIQQQLQSRIGQLASGIGTVALNGLSVASTLASVSVIATFATVFTLNGPDRLWNSALNLVPSRRRPHADAAMRKSVVTARWWMWASTVTGAVDGLFIGLGLHLLGVPLAVPIGVLTLILGYIPMVGATMAGAVAVAVALSFQGPTTALMALGVVLVVQQVEANVLSPLLMSRAMQFHPVVTLLVATGGGLAFGIVGLFLAVPVAGIIAAAVKGWRSQSEPGEPEPDGHPGPATDPAADDRVDDLGRVDGPREVAT